MFRRSTMVIASAFLMALLALSLSAPLLPTSPLSTVVSNAQEPFYPPTLTTEYPWTYKGGHVTEDGAYQWWFNTPGPGPLSNHILWRYVEDEFYGYGAYSYTGESCILCFNGKVYSHKHCFDAASGEIIWENPEVRMGSKTWGVAGWVPMNPQNYEGYSFIPNTPVYGVSTNVSDAYIYVPAGNQIQLVKASTGACSYIPKTDPYITSTGGLTPYKSIYWDFPVSGAFAQYNTRYYTTGNGILQCIDQGLAPGKILWDTLNISLDSTIEYPILQEPGVRGGRIMAKGAGSYERPPQEMINGTVFPTDQYLEWFRCYWGRYGRGGGCEPAVVTGENGIIYMLCGMSSINPFWNDTSGQWEPEPLDPSTGSGLLAWPYPWYLGDRGDGIGRSIGEPELLNINGGQIVACDWDYETVGSTMPRDSASYMQAYNMTDGKLLWRRVCSYGCFNPGCDTDKNIVWIGSGSTVHVWDATTGEKLWWFKNPDYAGELSETAHWIGYDGENIYATFWSGDTYALNGLTGEVVWHTHHGYFNGCSGSTYTSEASNTVYVAGIQCRGWAQPELEPGRVLAMDKTTGEILWTHDMYTGGGTGAGVTIADGRLYVAEGSNGLVCFAAGPTETSLTLSSEQLKAGDTVLISGQLLDKSPPTSGNYNAPCADCSVTLMYCPLGGASCDTIATVITGYAGDYYYEWTIPSNMTGMYSVLAMYNGDNPDYLESSAQANFRVGAGGLSETEMEQVTAAVPDYSMMFYAVIAVVIITLALVVFMLFRKK